MRSALLLTLGTCLLTGVYRIVQTRSGILGPGRVLGLTLDAAVTALCFGGASYLGLCVLDGDQTKVLPRGVLGRAQVLWLAQLGVLAAAPMTLGADVLSGLAGGRAAAAPSVAAPGPFILVLLKSALLAPALEELFFRGYLLGALERYGRGRAAAVSALCFALVHMGGQGAAPGQGMLYAAFGFLLAALRLRAGSLLAPMLVHGGYNLALLVLAYTGLGVLFDRLTLPACALRLGLCLAFVYCLRRAWTARSAYERFGKPQALTRRELALLFAAAALAALAAVTG